MRILRQFTTIFVTVKKKINLLIINTLVCSEVEFRKIVLVTAPDLYI